jgi:2-polyprenyl-6-hydroxyphenyl methylase/3-demethylubiquinone-9 3-methyltransferase
MIETQAKSYFIDPSYQLNLSSDNTVLDQYTSFPRNHTLQIPCYEFAAHFIEQKGLKSCIEFGSGSGYKLNKFISPKLSNVSGVEMKHSVEYCKPKYPHISWYSNDFDSNENNVNTQYDIVVCFDVIEHLVYPEILLQKIKSFLKPEGYLLISTPDRDKLYGKLHHGPPHNLKHVREWNMNEFACFLEHEKFTILSHLILPDQKLSLRDQFWLLRKGKYTKPKMTCQFAVCRLINHSEVR